MNKINEKFHEELKAWPFIEAFKIINKFGGLHNFKKPDKPKKWTLREVGRRRDTTLLRLVFLRKILSSFSFPEIFSLIRLE